MKKNRSKKSIPSTQRYLDIAEIHDDLVIIKNGSFRAVLLVSSMNFALKSEEEQNATISSYMAFLNALDFPLQIVIQSRKLIIDKYLEELKKREKEQLNELLKMQTREYRKYIEELVELGDIMSKRIYVIVPYNPAGDEKRSFLPMLSAVFSPTAIIKIKKEKFLRYKEELFKRVEKVSSGLQSMGLTSILLDTQSLIELFYLTYNPEAAHQQKLVEISKLQVE